VTEKNYKTRQETVIEHSRDHDSVNFDTDAKIENIAVIKINSKT